MTETTLYYLFSTLAQSFAAISALLAVFTHFKIGELKDFLVGDGQSILDRMDIKEPGYDFPNEKTRLTLYGRLRDSISRKSIFGISEVIQQLAKKEKDEGKSLQTNPRGLQYIENGFNRRMKQMTNIKSPTKRSIISAFVVIFLSLISIVFVNDLINLCLTKWFLIFLIFVISTYSLILTIKGIYEGLRDQKDV